MTAKKWAVGANHATGIKENIDPGKLVRSYRADFEGFAYMEDKR